MIENITDWDAILTKLSERVQKDFLSKETNDRFTFEYTKDVHGFKDSARHAFAEILDQLKQQTFDSYKGAFNRELEGRILKESHLLQKQFDEAANLISQLIYDSFREEAEKSETNFQEVMIEQISIMKEQNQQKIEKLIRSERSIFDKSLSDMRVKSENAIKQAEDDLKKDFLDLLKTGRNRVEQEFRELHENQARSFSAVERRHIQSLKLDLEKSNDRDLEHYRAQLNESLKMELTHWLDQSIDAVKQNNKLQLDAERARLSDEMSAVLQEKKDAWTERLNQWGLTIKLQTRPHKAKEVTLNMEQEAAKILRDLTGTIHQLRQQANMHIDQLSTTLRRLS